MSSISSRAAARGEPPHVRALPVAVLHLRLRGPDRRRLLVLFLVVRVAVLGEAEVDESAMPGVAEAHREANF
jgi:hypothetical protein